MNHAEIKKAVSEAIEEKMVEYWIDRQKHYGHHQFIESLVLWSDRISSTIVQTVVKTVIVAILALFIIGFAIWGRKS